MERERVTGIGGVFFKANDAKGLTDWYRRHLGVPVDADGYVVFPWREEADRERHGRTVWSAFSRDTKYFEPSAAPFMIITASGISTGSWKSCAGKAWRSIPESKMGRTAASPGSWTPRETASSSGNRRSNRVPIATQLEMLGEVALAIALGALIGLEREFAHKAAGLRTLAVGMLRGVMLLEIKLRRPRNS